eukprot:gene1485-1618_t
MELREKSTSLSTTESSTLLAANSAAQRKVKKKKTPSGSLSPTSITYRGVNIYQAAAQGSLPLCVLLWGMASAKRVNLMSPDPSGNNPLHMAALADTPEVANFLLQQTRGYLTEEVKLVDSRNLAGETPLMKTMTTGNFVVAKALIDEGSDPLATDSQGNSIFTLLAKSGKIWCLNSMYHCICNMHGTQVALELMCTLDNEAHSALDWAADYGDVNVVEFFVRKGLNPFRADGMNRTALYWAVKSNRIDAARFLMMCGCDPLQKDLKDQTPLVLAKKLGFIELYRVLRGGRSRYRREIPENIVTSIHCIDPSSTPKLYSLITAFVPFYAWMALMAAFIYYYRLRVHVEISPIKLTRWQSFLLFMEKLKEAPEKGRGFWLGSILVYGVYFWSCHYSGIGTPATAAYQTFLHWSYRNPLQLQAIDALDKDEMLYYVSAVFAALSFLSWLALVFIYSDPGIINTRESDFEEVLARSLVCNGPPPSSQYCRTTFVKKPLRSKYCSRVGCVVARMDHYCIWLNLTIGFKNHRIFLFLLFCHFCAAVSGGALVIRALARDLNNGNACTGFQILLSRDRFVVTLLGCLMVLTVFGVGALLYVQCGNIAENITINERINRQRYNYLIDGNGNPRNRFDRGAWNNILEFFRLPGFDMDYFSIFELPPELTQQNLEMRLSEHQSVGGVRRYFVGNTGLHALFGTQSVSGPPSVDLEMAQRNAYAESTDSGESSSEIFV